jgi:hypothetical protein
MRSFSTSKSNIHYWYKLQLLPFEKKKKNSTYTILKILKGNESPPGSPWPAPRVINATSRQLLYLSKAQFEIVSDLPACDIIQDNVRRYTNILFPPRIYEQSRHSGLSGVKFLTRLNIKITGASQTCPSYPDSNMDETCMIIEKMCLLIINVTLLFTFFFFK